ncbi:EamA family transporter [Agromyces intestinalis]|uniref:EamA family transporter n=1 Tax=Agromyces intestinalis TaxID=2592652 RepID=A0A5C1YIS4_9MICO|nr:EamA family transporter [Agromyces intestinalis]QEO15019.1 EamA family transporter [Agromyces intestinalis]
MLTAVLALSGAFVYGAADFVGGLAAKRISSVLAVALGAASGLIALLLVLPALGASWRATDLAWGALAGVAGTIAIGLLYACLAIGPMSILSPLTAVVSAITPMVWGVAVGGERFGPLGAWAIGLALVAVVLVGFVPERGAVRPIARGILMAIGSGAGIGTYYILIAQTSDASGLAPLVATRSVTAVLGFAAAGAVALVVLRRRAAAAAEFAGDAGAAGAGAAGAGAADAGAAAATASASAADTGAGAGAGAGAAAAAASRKRGVRLALGAGLADAAANALLLLALRAGDLSVAAVLGALYPAGTILLAAIVLKERIAPVQWVGLVLALAAAAMLAVG